MPKAKLKDAVQELLKDFGEIETDALFVLINQPGTDEGVLLRWNCTIPMVAATCRDLSVSLIGRDELPLLTPTRRLDA